MTKLSATMALSGALALSGGVQAADYLIDTKDQHASINFSTGHLGFSILHGRFDDFNGTFSWDKAHPEDSKVQVTINTASIDSNHAERDKHLRSADFLNTSKYPEATFQSTKVEMTGEDTAKVTGDFTLNGVTHPVVIDAQLIGEGDDPWGGYRAGFTGTTSIKLTDYAITKDLGPASAVVKLDLNIEGIRQ